MSLISITRTASYDLEQAVRDIRVHFQRFELEKKLTPDTHVLLKPNLLMKRRPEEFTTTHPIVVEAVIICLKELGISRIVLADSPGGLYTEKALRGIYEASGMSDMANRQGITLNYNVGHRNAKRPGNSLVKRFPIIDPVFDADFIINLPKLKTHAMTGLSGAVKNIFGCVPGLTKPEFHWRFPEKDRFCEMLVDLCETVSPDFHIVDAIEAMEGDGPSGGTRYDAGFLAASDQPYDLDRFLCGIMGIDPDTILTVKNSSVRGLCCDSCDIAGDSPSLSFRMPTGKGIDFSDALPGFLRKPVKVITDRFFTSKPVIQTDNCIGCMKCAESCPAKTISKSNGKAVIHYRKCIHCFCCHEMCPVKAIDIKRNRLFH